MLGVLDIVHVSVTELLLQIFTNYQTEKEAYSDDLHRMYVLAVEVIEYIGIYMADVPKQLPQ